MTINNERRGCFSWRLIYLKIGSQLKRKKVYYESFYYYVNWFVITIYIFFPFLLLKLHIFFLFKTFVKILLTLYSDGLMNFYIFIIIIFTSTTLKKKIFKKTFQFLLTFTKLVLYGFWARFNILLVDVSFLLYCVSFGLVFFAIWVGWKSRKSVSYTLPRCKWYFRKFKHFHSHSVLLILISYSAFVILAFGWWLINCGLVLCCRWDFAINETNTRILNSFI